MELLLLLLLFLIYLLPINLLSRIDLKRLKVATNKTFSMKAGFDHCIRRKVLQINTKKSAKY